MRALHLVLLVLALTCQSWASAQLPLIGNTASPEHLELHWNGNPHHHPSNGASVADDSVESDHHMVADEKPTGSPIQTANGMLPIGASAVLRAVVREAGEEPDPTRELRPPDGHS